MTDLSALKTEIEQALPAINSVRMVDPTDGHEYEGEADVCDLLRRCLTVIDQHDDLREELEHCRTGFDQVVEKWQAAEARLTVIDAGTPTLEGLTGSIKLLVTAGGGVEGDDLRIVELALPIQRAVEGAHQNYLVDANGVEHYFTKDGYYDGWGRCV